MADPDSQSEKIDSIVVVDPDAASRSAAEDLEDDFDRQIIAMDSVEFDIESSEEIIDASAYIISWNLEIRSGADLLEEIRVDERLEHKIVLIAMEAPTAESVRCALALGADGVCMKPYDAKEIAALLERANPSSAEKAA